MKRWLAMLAVVAAVVAFFCLLPQPEAPKPDAWPEQQHNSFALRGVSVFDGEQVLERRDVLVEDGLITVVSPKLPLPEGVPEYDATGHTLMPALIDAHTHNFGSSRVDALRLGVGTQIDMFSDVSALASARAAREALDRSDQADMWSAGTLVTARGGHGSQFGMDIPTLDRAADAAAFIDARIAEGSDFIKLVREPGDMVGRPLPTLDGDTLAAAIAAAKARGKLAVVHATTQADAALAVEAGADGLVHLFGDSLIEPELVEAMRAGDVFVIPTLAVMESISGRASGIEADARVAPWLTPSQSESLTRTFPAADEREGIIGRAIDNVRTLHGAGVRILAGSDAPNPGTAHGASLHRELELLVEAGMTPAQALAAATQRVAEAFGIEDRGRVAARMRADLVLVAGDPLADVTATRDIVAIWKNGYRIARPRFDGEQSALPVLEAPRLGSFDHGEDGWTPTTDRIQGGQSEASQKVEDGALVVSGSVKGGAAWPWGGTLRMFGAAPFDPVDASAYSTLSLRVRGDGGALTLLFFSGQAEQAIPVTFALEPGTEWKPVEVALESLAGLDLSRLRAISVVAGPDPREFRFEIDDLVLR